MGRKQTLQKQRETEITVDKNLKERGILYLVVFFGLCVLMFYPPYFRGLFFDKELLPTHMFTFVLFALWWIYKLSEEKDIRFLSSPLDYAALALVGAYLISLFSAVNIRLAVGELLKNINYFMAFWLTGEVLKRHKNAKVFLNILLASIIGAAILGIGALAGTFSYPGAVMGGRISSSVQYPNTLAALLTSAYFISVTLFLNSDKKWEKYLYSISSFILFFTFIFTYSRGAWLLFPIVALIYLVGTVKENRFKAVENFIVVFIPTLICIPGFSGSSGAKTWLWFAVGCALTALLYFLSSFVERISSKVKLAFAGVLVVVIIAGIIIGVTATKPIILEHTAAEDASWKSVSREIQDVKPDTEYILKMDIVSKNPDEQPYSWRVAINSRDEEGRSVSIFSETGTDTAETKELIFKTRLDTKDLIIHFQNYHPGTYVKFDTIELMEKGAGTEPLKIRTAYKYIPENLAKRITSISLEETSASGRFTFYKDAFKIIKDYPIIGAGGGGWASLYFGYQSHLYWSNQVHNYFMQVWIETGTLGLLAVISLWIMFFITVFKLLRSEQSPKEKQEIWGICIAAVALGSHSIIDFNLSLGAVALFQWFLFGLIKGKADERFSEKTVIDKNKSLAAYYAGSLIPCILLFALSLSLLAGYNYGQTGVRHVREGNVLEAANAFYKASKFDPFSSSYRADRGQLLSVIGRNSGSEDILEEAEDQLKKAVSLDRFNPKMHTYLGAFYLLNGNLEEGFTCLEKAVELHPYNPTYYEYLTNGYIGAAQEYIKMRNPEEAELFLDKALALIDKIKELNRQSKQKMETTPKLIMNLEKVAYMKNNIDRRSSYADIDFMTFALASMIDTTEDNIPDLWQKVNTSKSYLSSEIISRETGNYLHIENKGEGLGYLYSKDFTLNPNQEYELSMKVRGNIQPGKFRVLVISRKGEYTQFSVAPEEINEDWQEFEFTFTTTDDIEPGVQFLRIDHLGDDEGYIEIRDLYLWED